MIKKPVTGCKRKQKNRTCNIEDQGLIIERFSALQKEQIENQKAQEKHQYIFFFKTFLTNRDKWRMRNEIKTVNYIRN